MNGNPSDQFLRRSQVHLNQRTDLEDFNRTNESALGNLALAMRYVVSSGLGIVRGGALIPTTPPSMQCWLQPLGGVGQRSSGSGLIIVESDRPVTFTAADATYDRIDVVSIAYAEAGGSPESRWFENPPGTQFQGSNTETEWITDPYVRVTWGTPGNPPSVPDVPAGDLVLYHVRVRANATTIEATDITRAGTDWITPLKVAGALTEAQRLRAVTVNLPWHSDTIIAEQGSTGHIDVLTPANALTVFMGTVSLSIYNIINVALRLTVHDIDSDAIVGVRDTFIAGTTETNSGYNKETLSVFGAVVGPSTGTRSYRLKLVDPLAQQAQVLVSNITLVSLTL
jgi:hypothetical protein